MAESEDRGVLDWFTALMREALGEPDNRTEAEKFIHNVEKEIDYNYYHPYAANNQFRGGKK